MTLLTFDYPDSVERQSDYEVFWHILTVTTIVMILIMPAQFYLWLILLFALLMSFTAWRAGKGASVPVLAVSIIEAISSFLREDKEHNAVYEEHKDHANRFGIINLNEEIEDDEDIADDAQLRRANQRERVEDFRTEDSGEEEVWRI